MMLLAAPALLLLAAPALAQDTADTASSVFTASDCLAYIYTAWVFFIYAVGLGIQSHQYPQAANRNIGGTRSH